MSDAFYTGLQGTAARLLRDKGQTMTLRRRTPGAYDPAAGAATVTTVDEACFGIETDFNDRDIDGTRVRVGDRRVLLEVPALTAEPVPGDQIVVDGVARQIVACRKVAPAGVAVLYRVQVRG